jgi:DNA (cytosine-5)-methyltransferase 1
VSRKFTAIDLFSGCGGFSYGFQQAGFQVLLGVDNNDIALQTFKKNHINSESLNLDLHKSSSIDEIITSLKGKRVDVLIGGPPCQGYSLTGTRNEHDERNTLFNAMFQLAERVNPKAIIIENVPGLLKLYNGKAKKEIIKLCEEYGYSCNPQILFAPDYGVPQIRKRVFFVALKQDLGVFKFPDILLTTDQYIGCKAAIDDLPNLEFDLGANELNYNKTPTSKYQKLMRNGSKTIFNHVGTNHTDHVKNVISQVPEGGNHKDLPPEEKRGQVNCLATKSKLKGSVPFS